MTITDIRIRKMNHDSNMKAIISVTMDDEIVIHDIKIIEGEKGLFVAMPSRKIATGEFKDIAHPINASSRNKLQNSIIAKYEEALVSENLLEA